MAAFAAIRPHVSGFFRFVSFVPLDFLSNPDLVRYAIGRFDGDYNENIPSELSSSSFRSCTPTLGPRKLYKEIFLMFFRFHLHFF